MNAKAIRTRGPEGALSSMSLLRLIKMLTVARDQVGNLEL